ncbi:hypothetical protein GPECTOR_67g307 [Gonium pectorale]|uniref:snRNA-activating protein complex subunit 3 n=1 Tax=Gonium pectorale TaxID=33097 RepID=A0A150G3P1_GONPE|nr:hypothetical protein GPECTOR_67g307 [Gonium pectorale]|eukprot:KXZ44467.1 hypothetical protein GPECTOR_67g307 [Gonium pectorale]
MGPPAAGPAAAAAAGPAAAPLGSLPASHGSYVYLEGRFFVDVRYPEAEDYSRPIRELCRAHGVRPTALRPDRGWRPGLVGEAGQPVPEPAAMHETRLADLSVRTANHPTGIFCHRACCEHLIFIRDVRRWHPGDPPCRSAYPLQLRHRDRAGVPLVRRRCGLCESRPAELVTHDDPLAPSNPCIMCRECFDMLHISSRGERIAPAVSVQPYNPALDIASQGAWAIPPAPPAAQGRGSSPTPPGAAATAGGNKPTAKRRR